MNIEKEGGNIDNKQYDSAAQLKPEDESELKNLKVEPKEPGLKRQKTGKVSAIIDGPKNHPLSYAYGVVSALALGASLYFSADLGLRHDGFVGPASFWPGCILTWFLFHTKDWIMWITGKTPDPCPGERWFCNSKRSMYYELYFIDDEDDVKAEGGNKVAPVKQDNEAGEDADELKEAETKLGWSCTRFQGSISRGIIELLINVALIYSFMFAEKSGINPGIISSIFSSTCVFTIIMFYFLYGQKLSLNDWAGTFFIILCVVFISVGGGDSGSEEETVEEATRRMLAGPSARSGPREKLSPEEANMYLYFSVIAALAAGFVLSVNTVSLQYCVRVGCRIDQANFDGNFLMFMIFFPMYLIIEYNSPGTYSMRDLFSGSMDIICITIGVIALGKGLACGNGGPMQAIENQKTVVVTIITAIVFQRMPTVLQICGLVSGIVGVLCIVFQKQKKEEEKKEEGEENKEGKEEEKAKVDIGTENQVSNQMH